ncbi:MAG: zinc ribbon domain-containing protein, partial [Gammaproteobacteria bacterium]|nr:zinc ribbon domain-containing protein [Gammaproteobacteria bacterium]
MPFYEYQCQNCQYYTEVMQKITDAPLKKCPSCGRMTLVKLISAPVFRLKGSGWYETDFKSDQERKRNLAGADAEAPKSAEAAAPSGEKSSAKSAEASDAKREPKRAAAVSAPAAKPAARKRAKPAARPA